MTELKSRLSYRNIGAVYVLLAIVIGSSIALPDTFLTDATFKQVLNSNAVTVMAALAVVIPLTAGVFDLSFAYTMSLAGVICAHFAAETNVGLVPAVVLAILAGLAVGVIN